MKLKSISFIVCFFVFFTLCTESVLADKKMSRKAERQLRSITALLEKADQKLESGEPEEATKLYGATISAYQEFSSKYSDANTEIVKFRVAYCRNQLMSLLAADRISKDAKENNPADSVSSSLSPELSALIAENIGLCQSGQYDKVESSMLIAIKSSPNCSQAYLLLSTACIGKGKLDEAMKFLKKAIKINPSNSDAHYNLCQLLIRADKPDFNAATTHYKISVELGSDQDVDLEAVLDL